MLAILTTLSTLEKSEHSKHDDVHMTLGRRKKKLFKDWELLGTLTTDTYLQALLCTCLGLMRLIYEENDVRLMYKDGEVALGVTSLPTTVLHLIVTHVNPY